jgi:histidyl-tRNA synthetase
MIKSLKIDNVEFVLREIDKIDKQGEDIVKQNLAKFISKDKIIGLFGLLRKPLSFFKKLEGYKELNELIKLCKIYKINVKFKPTLARGLSYYNGSIFEIKTEGMKETIAAGGSYLINGIQSTGISFGLERLSQLAKLKLKNKQVLIVNISQDKKAIELAEKLRNKGKQVIISDKISKALEFANSQQIPQVIFLGKEEVKKKKFKLRDMKTGKEEFLGEKELIERLAKLFIPF